MAAIHELLKQITDPALRERIAEEFERSTRGKKFGLVFEDHIPERLPLYGFEIKRGRTVAKKTGKISDTWQVIEVLDLKAHCRNQQTGAEDWFPLSDLVVVAEYNEPVYPALEPLDKVVNAPDSTLWHTLIEGDNYYALQLLEYLYAGKIDCIYIDPPYNLGGDFVYNDSYVGKDDQYRHSKWLSFMKRRLQIAFRLLSPEGIIFISINDNEFAHLKLLCDDIFSINNYQATLIWKNRQRADNRNKNMISTDHEYILVYGKTNSVSFLGEEKDISKYSNPDNDPRGPWASIDLSGLADAARRPNLHFNIVNPETGIEYPPNPNRGWSKSRETIAKMIEEKRILWPSSPKGRPREKKFLRDLLSERTGFSSVLNSEDVGYTTDGTKALNDIFEVKAFNFPKSVQLIKTLIAQFPKKSCVVLDFFAGSGTTLHAVNILNKEDGGHRRCIMVTNNEVSAEDAKTLTSQGYKPGDEEWEKRGIARSVTWPRTVCSIEGHNIKGNPLKSNNLGSDITMADGFASNCEFFHLTYLEKDQVSLGQCFEDILPLLWLQSGAIGPRPGFTSCEEEPEMLILPENRFAVLIDDMSYGEFSQAVKECGKIDHVYFVTNSDSAFKEMAEDLEINDAHQLYRDYVENFRISAGRMAA